MVLFQMAQHLLVHHQLVLLLAFLHHQNRQNQRHQLVLLLGQLEQGQEQRVLLVRDCPVLIYIF
jgi:hypothetical protein